MIKDVFIVAATRTPVGKLGGALKNVLPEELTTHVIRRVLEKANLDVTSVDEVIFGQTKQSADCPNVARVAALIAGIPEETPAYTVHRQCSSGMQAAVCGAQQIQTGDAEIVLCGGVESMSTAPYYLRNARYGFGAGNGLLLDPNTESQPRSQPSDRYGELIMGMTAETLAERYDISREAQDAFAYESQMKAIAAIDSGRFSREIAPLVINQKKNDIVFETDEFPRRDTSPIKLAGLRPAFKQGGTVTAGNSSGRNDGAAAMILASKEALTRYDLQPLARIVSYAAAGVDPRVMGTGPVPSTRKALEKCGLRLDQIGLIEINEAFAAQTLACVKELEIDRKRLNVNGGAIALGHPLGMSGARIITTLVHEMTLRDERYGLASICVAGGLGMAMICEKA